MTYRWWTPKETTCKQCGKTFTMKAPGHKFCNSACREASDLIEIKCAVCGNPFTRDRHLKGRVCSDACGLVLKSQTKAKKKGVVKQTGALVPRKRVTAATFQAASPEKFARMVCDCDLVPTAILARRSETEVSGIVFKERRGKSGRVARGVRV